MKTKPLNTLHSVIRFKEFMQQQQQPSPMEK